MLQAAISPRLEDREWVRYCLACGWEDEEGEGGRK